MIALSIPAYCAARSPGAAIGFPDRRVRRVKRIAMPRFRKDKEPIQLTEAVRRILVRASTNSKPFGVFIVKGRLLMSCTETSRFAALERRWSDALIGTYDARLTIDALLEDLRAHFLNADTD